MRCCWWNRCNKKPRLISESGLYWLGGVVLFHYARVLFEVYVSLEVSCDCDLMSDGESHEFRSIQKFPYRVWLCVVFGMGEVAIE